jgi:hypothetical protein
MLTILLDILQHIENENSGTLMTACAAVAIDNGFHAHLPVMWHEIWRPWSDWSG